MAIEIVSFPIENGDFPVRYVTNYQAGYPGYSPGTRHHGHPDETSHRGDPTIQVPHDRIIHPWAGVMEGKQTKQRMDNGK